MNKTKLGISTNMLAAFVFALFLCAITSGSAILFWALLFVVGYVMYREEDSWLKASAVKAVFLFVVYFFVGVIFSFVDDSMSFVNFFFEIAETNTYVQDGSGIMNFIELIAEVVIKIVYIILMFMAFKGKTIKIPVIDKVIDKHVIK